MRRLAVGSILMFSALAGCSDDSITVVDPPAAPTALTASYYGGVVTVRWELGPGWSGEAFRIYSRRVTDADFFFIAEVTSCSAGECVYEDTNVAVGQTYEYYVSAVDPGTGVETATDFTVDVFVPQVTPAPVPEQPGVVALDAANYLTWSANARSAPDFSHYRVYQRATDGSDYFLGETDSEGFLDLLAANGSTYSYFVTSMDVDGHESAGSGIASGTPRPDYHGEFVYDYLEGTADSGFRFQEDESSDPILDGDSPLIHFRLEEDASGWWLVPGPQAAIYLTGFATTALKCGVGADAACLDLSVAPNSGYAASDVALEPQTTYVLRVVGDDGQQHYGVIRVELLGYDQSDNALMIFDWAYQLQPGNRNLVAPAGG